MAVNGSVISVKSFFIAFFVELAMDMAIGVYDIWTWLRSLGVASLLLVWKFGHDIVGATLAQLYLLFGDSSPQIVMEG